MPRRLDATCFAGAFSVSRRPTVAVSACLAGQRVRYDGGDKPLSSFERLSAELHLLPICPEVGAGLSVPRPPVELVQGPGAVHALGRDDRNLDVTERLEAFARHSLAQLRAEPLLCGYIWKSRSPSCGLGSAPLFDDGGQEIALRSGVQAALFQRELPWLSFCDENDLADNSGTAAFVLRCRLVADIVYSGIALVDIHRHYDFLLAHFPPMSSTLLRRISETGERGKYMAALQTQCGHLDREELLSLFSD